MASAQRASWSSAASAAGAASATPLLPGTVVESHGKHGTVLLHGSGLRLRCKLEKELAQRDVRAGAEHFVIGDRVAVAVPAGGLAEASASAPAAGAPAAAAVAAEREPRSRTLCRHLSAHSQRAIATAIDQLVLVTAVQPPPNRGLLDRFIVLAEAEGIDVLLVLNKIDLGGDALRDARATLSPYMAAGYSVQELSVSRGDGLADLRARLAAAPGRLSILAGHSGVGKSSLMNELVPDARLPTDELSRSRRGFRGRHMTTRRTCHLLSVEPSSADMTSGAGSNSGCDGWPAGSAMVVDTAGVRSFGLVGVPHATLLRGFREFQGVEAECRYARARCCCAEPANSELSRLASHIERVKADHAC